ncbi:MAG TPA: tetratricopeptide repeat protein [Longimicrobiaceae bacterium]|nr:tetratricopeptide repeat protein [Longimicrobiaceae bacterium]
MAEVPSELVAEVRKLERYHAENPQGRYFVPLANAYRGMGEVDQAEALLREGLRRHPDYLSAHIVLGRCLADRGATGEAVGEFRYVLSVDPQNLIALRSLGELAVAGGRSDEAARWYRELLAVDPMNEDARQALESLEAAADEQIPGGAAEWGRNEAEIPAGDLGTVQDPLGWGPEGGDAGAASPADTADDTLSWGEISLEADTPPGEAPGEETSPELYGGIDLGEIEMTDAGTGATGGAEAWSGGGTGEWDPLAGGAVDLDPHAYGAPEEMDDGEVVTETIAELYARQGFYDRAAEVYRELIRRRGGDAVLEDRLREMELRANGHFLEPEAGAALAPGAFDTGTATPVGDVDLGGAPDLPLVHAGAADWIEAAPEAAPAPDTPGSREDVDAFASSFETGFAEMPSDGALPAFAGARNEVEPTDADAVSGEEWGAAATPPPAAHGTPVRSVREYLASLAAWRPGAGVAETASPAAAAETTAAEPEATGEQSEGGGDDLPWMAVPVSGESGEAGVVGIEGQLAVEPGASTAEDEPYPWEAAPAPPPAEESAPPPSPAESAFSFEEFFMDVAETPAPEAAAPPSPAVPSAPEPGRSAEPAPPAAGSDGEDDEDLESFQAWLQSLKR